MPRKAQVIFNLPVYPRIFDLIDRYKINVAFYSNHNGGGRWSAGMNKPTGDQFTIGEFVTAESKICALDAITQLLEKFGHHDEIWKPREGAV